jgi:glycosyltransferase involved in cell wall biosynthesis
MFSIVIPFYNSDFIILKRAIDSIILSSNNCNFLDFEIILVDDGSSKDFKLIINKEYSNYSVKYLRLDLNRGRSFARNHGIKNSEFLLILFLDSDDVVLIDYFSVLLKFKSILNEEIKFLTFSYKLNKFNVYRIFNPFNFCDVSPFNYKFFCSKGKFSYSSSA